MAVSSDTEHGTRTTFYERLFGQLTRYDIVLTVIPLLFVVPALGSALTPIPFLSAVAAGAILSGLLLADALFFNPPIGEA